MLVWPHQMYLTGITAGIVLEIVAGLWNIWTMCAPLMNLYICRMRSSMTSSSSGFLEPIISDAGQTLQLVAFCRGQHAEHPAAGRT